MNKAELSAKLLTILARKNQKEKLEKDLAAVNHELEEKLAQLKLFSVTAEKEWQDVVKLEKTSLTALFYTVLGSREEQLEKERQEFLAAHLAHEKLQIQVNALQQEQKKYLQQLEPLSLVEVEHETVLQNKAQVLLQEGDSTAIKLLKVLEEIAAVQEEIREIDEAFKIGTLLLTDFEQVLKILKSARNWGTWDTFFGGGLLSTLQKHTYIDEAKVKIYAIQERVTLFNRELADVKAVLAIQLEISHLEDFADIFFDSLITDWIVQSKIEATLEQVYQAQSQVQEMMRQLENKRETAGENLQKLQLEKTQLIEQA